MNNRFFSLAEAFVAVARMGSITGAADALRLSKANISHKLSQLEQDLDVVLFRRNTRRVELTSAGQKILDVCADAVDAVALARLHAAPPPMPAQDLQGEVTISGSNIYLSEILLPKLAPFCAQHPKVTLKLLGSDHPINVKENNVDLRVRIGKVDVDGMRIMRLPPLKRILCCGENLQSEAASMTHPNQLSALPAVLREQEKPVWVFQNGGTEARIPVSGHMIVNSYELCINAVRNGHGFAIISRSVIEDDLQAGRLVHALPDWTLPDIPVSLLATYDRLRKPQVGKLTTYLREALEGSL